MLCKNGQCAGCVSTNTRPHQLHCGDQEMGTAISCMKCSQVVGQNSKTTSVMINHRGASLSEQHNDLLCTKQDLSHTSRYVDESSPEIARYCISMPTARTATLSVTTYA